MDLELRYTFIILVQRSFFLYYSALELLDYSYRQDDDQAQQLLTCELQNWSGQTCLSLAVAANHRALLAHPCSQIILADLWMGGLRTRKNTNIKVIIGLLFPFYIAKLEFKSKEELQLMPQTQEEHLENESIEDDKLEDKTLDGEVSIQYFINSLRSRILICIIIQRQETAFE